MSSSLAALSRKVYTHKLPSGVNALSFMKSPKSSVSIIAYKQLNHISATGNPAFESLLQDTVAKNIHTCETYKVHAKQQKEGYLNIGTSRITNYIQEIKECILRLEEFLIQYISYLLTFSGRYSRVCETG
jgi:hypothetical protein